MSKKKTAGKTPKRKSAIKVEPKPHRDQHYVMVVECCEPSLDGPYDDFNERDRAAKKISEEMGSTAEGIFWLDIRSDGPHVGAFTDFEEDDDLEDDDGLDDDEDDDEDEDLD
jgi:hypothetical protein